MVTYCENRESMTVLYTNKSGTSGKFFSKDVPLSVECNTKVRTGKFIFTAKTSGFTNPTTCQTTGLLNIQSTYEADSYSIAGNAAPVPNFENCPVQNIEFYIDTEVVGNFRISNSYQITSIPNPNYSLGGKFLIIKSQQGVTLFQVETKDCNFDISCGDDCLEGSHKCTHNKYPGYCCVPCQEVGDRLKNIASKVGR